ncbi:hypothetical protein X971_1203 [Agrobacterium tumefaciens LBA4213 (Ach5)]|nr:hypothetical protein X971_1203 [Agrobacterium tumefaciens LBA4213 (Ach5)]
MPIEKQKWPEIVPRPEIAHAHFPEKREPYSLQDRLPGRNPQEDHP